MPALTFWQRYRTQVWADWHRPKVYKFMCWVMIFCYPALARKSMSVYDCMPAGFDDDGYEIALMVADPAPHSATAHSPMYEHSVITL